MFDVDTFLAKLSDIEDEQLSLTFLKASIIELSKVVKEQQKIIDHQACQIQGIETLFQESNNESYSLSKRVVGTLLEETLPNI